MVLGQVLQPEAFTDVYSLPTPTRSFDTRVSQGEIGSGVGMEWTYPVAVDTFLLDSHCCLVSLS